MIIVQGISQDWDIKQLGDIILSVQTGTTPPSKIERYYNGEVAWFRPEDIGSDKFLSRSSKSITQQAIQEKKARMFDAGTLLVTCIGNIGRAGIIIEKSSSNQQITGIVVDNSICLTEYVYWWFQFIQPRLHISAPGGIIKILNQSNLLTVPIPVPYGDNSVRSLLEQRRIVARLEALLGEVREMRTLQEKVKADIGQLMEAVLAEVFPDPDKTLPEGWRVWSVGQISREPQYGYTASAKLEAVGPKFLRITDIQNGIVDWNLVPFCEIDDVKFRRYQLKEKDIVFARSGATTGKTYLVKEPPQAAFASYLIRLQIERIGIPEFVYWFFQSPYYWRQITLRGGAQPNMNATLLKQVRIPIPDDEKFQQRCVQYLDAISAEIEFMRATAEKDTQRIDDLEQSILSQAFRGEL